MFLRISFSNATPHVSGALALLAAQSLFGANPGDMRPALIGSGPNSLVNLIGTKHLMQRGV